MNSRRALHALLAIVFLYAVLSGYIEVNQGPLTKLVDLTFSALMLAFTYIWYYLDANERCYKRSTLLGGAIILFSVLSVPYYLYKSRPTGQKLKAVLKFLAVCLLTIIVATGSGLAFGA